MWLVFPSSLAALDGEWCPMLLHLSDGDDSCLLLLLCCHSCPQHVPGLETDQNEDNYNVDELIRNSFPLPAQASMLVVWVP